jgi:hypothetical protein
LSCSMPRCCTVPIPDDAKLSLPGLFLAYAINSLAFETGRFGRATRMLD